MSLISTLGFEETKPYQFLKDLENPWVWQDPKDLRWQGTCHDIKIAFTQHGKGYFEARRGAYLLRGQVPVEHIDLVQAHVLGRLSLACLEKPLAMSVLGRLQADRLQWPNAQIMVYPHVVRLAKYRPGDGSEQKPLFQGGRHPCATWHQFLNHAPFVAPFANTALYMQGAAWIPALPFWQSRHEKLRVLNATAQVFAQHGLDPYPLL